MFTSSQPGNTLSIAAAIVNVYIVAVYVGWLRGDRVTTRMSVIRVV